MRGFEGKAADKSLDRVAFAAIAAALAFGPLAYGSVEPWATSVLAVLAYTALAAALVRLAWTGKGVGMLTPVLGVGLLSMVLVAVQTVALPAGVVGVLSPRAVEIHREAASAVGSNPDAFTLSVYPHATAGALLRLSAYLALFGAVCAYVRSRREIRRLAGLILAVGFGVGLLGIIQNLSGTRKIYWWRELTRGGSPFGPFVSRNQFAAYAGLCVFVGLGLVLARAAVGGGSLRRWLRAVRRGASEKAPQNFMIVFACALVAASVFWSLSRAGIISMLLAGAVVLLVLGVRRSRGRRLHIAALAVFALGWVTYLGWEPVFSRLATLEDIARQPQATYRWQMVGDALRMGRDFPAVGTGAGTFLSAYPLYRTLPTRSVAYNPHNEYAGVFAETGVPGLLILLAALGLVYGVVLGAAFRRRNPWMRGFLAGGVGALLAPTLHSIVDFPMRSPGIAATVAVVVAMLWRAARVESNGSRRHKHEGGAEEEETRSEVLLVGDTGRRSGREGMAGSGPVIALVVVVTWLAGSYVALNPLRGELLLRQVHRAREALNPGNRGVARFLDAAERSAERHSPADAALYSEMASLAWEAAEASEDPLEGIGLAERAVRLRRRAVTAEPLNAAHSYNLLVDLLGFGRVDLAAEHAERVARLLPRDPWARVHLSEAFRAYAQEEESARWLAEAERLVALYEVPRARPAVEDARERFSRTFGGE